MRSQKLTEAAEKISGIFGVDAFSEQTFKVRDILADFVPEFEFEKQDMENSISSAIDELKYALRSIRNLNN